jgi:hypothetical protein
MTDAINDAHHFVRRIAQTKRGRVLLYRTLIFMKVTTVLDRMVGKRVLTNILISVESGRAANPCS